MTLIESGMEAVNNIAISEDADTVIIGIVKL